MGQWLSANQEAVYGTRGGPYLPSKKMVSTHKENKIYLHMLERTGRELVLPMQNGIGIKSAYFLQNGTPLKVQRDNDSFTLQLPSNLPDKVASVIVLELETSASEIDLIKL